MAHAGTPQAPGCAAPSDVDCAAAQRNAIADARRAADREGEGAVPVDISLDAALGRLDIRLQPGDVLLLRSDELMSAAISQIGTAPAFFSHMAIVGLDPQWNSLEIVETDASAGLSATPLDDWLERSFVRAAVYRHRDAAVALRAAIAAYRDAAARDDEARRYDFAFALDEPSRLYCTELIRAAFAAAAPDAPAVPAQLSDVGTLIDTFPLTAFGMKERQVFVPDDLELDARFVRVLELRVPQQLARVAAMDRVLRTLFDGLRGERRAEILAAIDRERPAPLAALPRLLRGSYTAYRRLPEDARVRAAALAQIVTRELETEMALAHP
ncbi:MAG: YiiX/YebB-like N1pC/P60 family cysteine hydrolase [Gammaproteobacteria bacterium]